MIALLLLALPAPQVARPWVPPVSEVVVYPDRARITRAVSAACGEYAVVEFPGIPPVADETTLRAHTVAGTLEGLRFERRTRADAYAPAVQALDGKIRGLERAERMGADAIERERAAASLAQGLAATALALMGREMLEPDPAVGSWRAALESSLEARLRAGAAIGKQEAVLRGVRRQLAELRAKRAELAASATREELVAEAVISCPAGQRSRVTLSYTVGGAGWEPAYEARLGNGGAVTLTTVATVRQTTGEDWHKVRLTLSTAAPRQDATPPEVQPLPVWADKRQPPKKVLTSREESRRHADAPGGSAGEARGRVAVQDQGLSVQMTAPELGDVPGDGAPTRLVVARNALGGTLRRRATPAILPYVFRVVELGNATSFPLLPGPVDVFSKGEFLGRTGVEHVGQGARFDLSFGIEEGVRVERTVLREARGEKGVFGGTIAYEYAYRLEVRNSLPRAGSVEIHESVPVSELADVKVAIDPRTTSGYEHRRADGLVVWRLELRPGERRALDLVFRVEAPASYTQ